MASVEPPAPPGAARRFLALAGAAAALGSLAVPYATLSLSGRSVRVAATLDARTPLLVLPVLVVVGAALAAVDSTRGEQLLGALFAVVLVATVLGPLVVVDLTGSPEPGLWLLLAAWVLVDAADDLDPELSNAHAGRRTALIGLGVVLVAGSAFLWVHRTAVTDGWTTALAAAWTVSGALATGGWVAVAAWEWTAVRG